MKGQLRMFAGKLTHNEGMEMQGRVQMTGTHAALRSGERSPIE